MANAESRLKIVVDAQNNATAGLRGVSRELGTIETNASKLKGVLSALKGSAAVAAAGIAAGGFNAIKAGAQYEQTQIAFETMLGSADVAQKTLSDLAEFASSTPFELPQLEESAKRLLAYNTSAEDLLPTLKMLGDISAGVGMDKMPQLILAFGQVQAATKLTGAELRQFSEAGVPLLGALADKFGITEGAVIEMVSAGEIGFEDMKAALSTLTDEGGKFNNLMEKQAGSLSGLWSNLKDQISLTARALGEDMLPYIKPVVEEMINLATHLRENGPSIFEGINNGINGNSELMQIMRGYWLQATEAFNTKLKPALDYFGEILKENEDDIKLILSTLGKFIGYIAGETVIGAIKFLAWLIERLGDGFNYTISFIAEFIRMVEKTIEKVQRLIDLVAGSKIGKSIGGFFDGARANGGPVSAGGTYLVGEKGPEIFRPATSGTIIPNKSIAPAFTSPTIYITGNTLLSDDVAVQIGDMFINRAKLSGQF